MKISKAKLRQIIKEELSSLNESPNEFTNYLLQMYQDLSETADIATIREIIQDNFNSALEAAENAFLGEPALEEGWGGGDQAYQQATHLLGKYASLHRLRNQVADALRQRRVSPQQVEKAVQRAVSSYDVARRLGLK